MSNYRAVDADGQHGPWSERVFATPHADLAAPELSAQPAAGAVDLTWTEVPDGARYQLISWWDADTGWQLIGGDNLTAAYTHTDVTAGTTYYYRIRAVDADGQPGPWSQQLSASVPGAPASTTTPAPTLTPTAAPLSATPTATPTAAPAPTPPAEEDAGMALALVIILGGGAVLLLSGAIWFMAFRPRRRPP